MKYLVENNYIDLENFTVKCGYGNIKKILGFLKIVKVGDINDKICFNCSNEGVIE